MLNSRTWQGDRRSMAQAIYVITAAVDRYKELCEGKYNGVSARVGMHAQTSPIAY